MATRIAALLLLVAVAACQAPSVESTASALPTAGASDSAVPSDCCKVDVGSPTPGPGVPLPSRSPVAPDVELGSLTPEPTVPLPSGAPPVAPDVELGTPSPDPTVVPGPGG